LARAGWAVPGLFLILFTGSFSVPAAGAAMPEAQIRGVEIQGLREVLEGHSPAFWQSTRPPESEAALRGAARRHEDLLKRALASEGYYGATVSFALSWPELVTAFDVVPGPQYQMDAIAVRIWEREDDPSGGGEITPPQSLQLRLDRGAPARAVEVIGAEEALVAQLTEMGYPFARALTRDALVDHDRHTMDITYRLESGGRYRFGPPRMVGLDKVRAEVVHREISWLEGAWYDQRRVKETQEKLQKTGLFSLTRLYPAAQAEAEEDRLPICLELTERPHRTVSLGLQYRTDEGIGAAADWEHRNFMRLGRSLRLSSQVTELEQNFGVNYVIQDFMNSRNTLTLHGKVGQLDTDFYQSRRIDIGAWLEHPYSSHWNLGFGPALRVSRVKQRSEAQNYYLLSFPVEISGDYRDDRMDPQRGYRVVNRMTPFLDVHDAGTWFVKDELTLSWFTPLGEVSGYTLATRLHLGVAAGASLSTVPADERMYAGGGGSIRGYAYQEVGPLDKYGEPTGGRSVTDWSLELRKRINEQFGLVVFVDGGAAHESAFFDFGDSIQWGAGIGVRYYTPIGPLRFDVAVPLNPREDIDSSVQFYISIGQAF